MVTCAQTIVSGDQDGIDLMPVQCVLALINTRGTGEIQGESAGFTNMNARVMQLISGGTLVSDHPAYYSVAEVG